MFRIVEHVTSDEKYECVILDISCMYSKISIGSVHSVDFSGFFLGIHYLYLMQPYNFVSNASMSGCN